MPLLKLESYSDWAEHPEICPSSVIDENYFDTENSAHRWDTSTVPISCVECGAQQNKPIQIPHTNHRPLCSKCGYGFAAHELSEVGMCATCTDLRTK